MADYLEVEDAKGRPGLRLALTAGFPGPWGESAKGILHVKKIPYLRVRQRAGEANEALREWTGRSNAPVAVYDDEPPVDGWAEILALAERVAPEPRLVPEEGWLRVRMFGLAREIAGVNGLGWLRRLQLMDAMLGPGANAPAAASEGPRTMAARYGYHHEAARAATPRIVEILGLLDTQLREGTSEGGRYFLGESLTALDIYWAAFAALLDPLPEEQCALGGLRALYRCSEPAVREAMTPALMAHRDFVYETHLELPLAL